MQRVTEAVPAPSSAEVPGHPRRESVPPGTSAPSIVALVREHWGWAGIDPAEVVGENDFGHRVIVDSAGRFWRLSPEDLRCEILAANRSAFEAVASGREFLADWQMSALAARAREALGPLPSGMKFDLVLPAALGGGYDPANLRIVEAGEQLRVSATRARSRPAGLRTRWACRCGRC